MIQELPDVQARFRKGRQTRDQIANIHWIIEKAKFQNRNFRISISVSLTAKVFDCVDHDKLWKALRETCMWVKKQQLERCMEQLIASRSRKE